MKLLRIISLAAALSLCALPAAAQDTSAQEAKKAKLQKEMAILDRQISENRAQSKSALSQLELSRKKVSLQREMVAESDRQIRDYTARISDHEKEIGRLQGKVDTLSLYYG